MCLWSVTCATGYTLGRMHFDIADTDRDFINKVYILYVAAVLFMHCDVM